MEQDVCKGHPHNRAKTSSTSRKSFWIAAVFQVGSLQALSVSSHGPATHPPPTLGPWARTIIVLGLERSAVAEQKLSYRHVALAGCHMQRRPASSQGSRLTYRASNLGAPDQQCPCPRARHRGSAEAPPSPRGQRVPPHAVASGLRSVRGGAPGRALRESKLG